MPNPGPGPAREPARNPDEETGGLRRLSRAGVPGDGLRTGTGRAMVASGALGRPRIVLNPLSPFQHSSSPVVRALRDVLFVVAALALLGAQAFSTLHYVLVPHHLCAVHGVLEDRHDSMGDGEHAASTDQVSIDADEEAGHDACSVATRNDDGALIERPALTDSKLLDDVAQPAWPGAVVAADRSALLSSAPKTSPPVGA